MAVPAHKVSAFMAELISEPTEIRTAALIREIRRALEAPSLDIEAISYLHTALGVAYTILRQEDQALDHHRTACGLCASRYSNPTNYAVSLERFGRYSEALPLYIAAVEADDGENAEAIGNLAVALSRIGDSDEARRLYLLAGPLASSPFQFAFMAQKAAQLGFNDDALRWLAKASASGGEEEARAVIRRTRELRVALMLANKFGAALARLRPYLSTAEPADLSAALALDEAVLQGTKDSRDRATYVGLEEVHDG